MEADWKCLAWGEQILQQMVQDGWRIEYTPSELFSDGVVLFKVKVIHVHWPEGAADYALLLHQIARVVRGVADHGDCPCDGLFTEAYLELVRRYMRPMEVVACVLKEAA